MAIQDVIKKQVGENRVVLYMKGTPDFPQCGFSANAVGILRACGVERIFGGNYCTYSEPQRFHSYRRDGTTGRMAALIWLSE